MFCDADTDTSATEQVVLMVVVEAEVAPILEELQFVEDQATTDELLGLARVRSGEVGAMGMGGHDAACSARAILSRQRSDGSGRPLLGATS